jgi:Tudor domain
VLHCFHLFYSHLPVRDLHIPDVVYPSGAKYLMKGMEISVKVLHIVSPTQFWIHNKSSSDLQNLEQMSERMTIHYNSLPAKLGFRYCTLTFADMPTYDAQLFGNIANIKLHCVII